MRFLNLINVLISRNKEGSRTHFFYIVPLHFFCGIATSLNICCTLSFPLINGSRSSFRLGAGWSTHSDLLSLHAGAGLDSSPLVKLPILSKLCIRHE